MEIKNMHKHVPSNMKSHNYKRPPQCLVFFLKKNVLYSGFVCGCVCLIHPVLSVFHPLPTLSEKAKSVECGGPVLSVFSQTPAHENLFRRVQFCHINRYKTPDVPIKALVEYLNLVIHKGFAS